MCLKQLVRGVASQFHLSDLVAMDFVWAICQPKCPSLRIRERQPEIVTHAGATMDLDRPIDDAARH